MNLIPLSINGLNKYAVYACGLCSRQLEYKTNISKNIILLKCTYCNYDASYNYIYKHGRFFCEMIVFAKFRICQIKDGFKVFTSNQNWWREEPALIIPDIKVETMKRLEKLMLL